MSTLRSPKILYQENLDLTEAELLRVAQSLSGRTGSLKEQLLHWEFGPIMTMKYDSEAKNYLFSSEAVPFHWDGAFAKEPQKLLFYCTESTGLGGETLFVDTEELWLSLTADEQQFARNIILTYRTEKLAHYGGEIRVPLVQQHPESGAIILRLAERVETSLNPVTLTIEGVENPENFYQRLMTKMYQQSFSHQWKKGDLLCVDNFTFLHGRRPLGNNRSRSFKRIQIL